MRTLNHSCINQYETSRNTFMQCAWDFNIWTVFTITHFLIVISPKLFKYTSFIEL